MVRQFQQSMEMGLSLDAAASECGISISTLRTYLRQGEMDLCQGIDSLEAEMVWCGRSGHTALQKRLTSAIMEAVSKGDNQSWRAALGYLKTISPSHRASAGRPPALPATPDQPVILTAKMLERASVEDKAKAYRRIREMNGLPCTAMQVVNPDPSLDVAEWIRHTKAMQAMQDELDLSSLSDPE